MDSLINAGPARVTVDAVRWPSDIRARMRLYCLPHAGGGAATYFPWARRLAPDIEVVALRLPGRETRHREPAARRIGDIVPAVTRVLADGADQPFAVFGHSFGALLAFEACRELARQGLAHPTRLLVSGRPAPHLGLRLPPVHAAPDESLRARLKEMGGTPPEILSDASVMAGLLPTLRADLEAAETYACRPGPALDVPISVFGGAQDLYTEPPDLHAWGQYSRVGHRVRIYQGQHFFLHEDPDTLLEDIRLDLCRPTDSRRPMALPLVNLP